jgi:hypothetical protein
VIGGIEFAFGLGVAVVQEAREDENIIDGYLESVSLDEGEVKFDRRCPLHGQEDKIFMCIDSLELGYSDVTTNADDIKAWLGLDVLEHAAKLLESEDYEPVDHDDYDI